MLDENNENTWQKVIMNFFAEKYEADFSKYLKDLLKDTSQLYEKEKFYENESLAFIFDTRKNKRLVDQPESVFLLEQFASLSNFDVKPVTINFDALNGEINTKKQEFSNKFSPRVWLTWAAKNAKNVTFATHVSKLTHSAIDSPSFFDSKESTKNSYLSTSNLNNAVVDGAVRGNQFAPIYQFLELELNGKKLASEFNRSDSNFLACFAQNEQQEEDWKEGFSAALSEGKPAAHFLLKQVYFPIAEEGQYHLLINLVSSSKAQSLFEFTRRNSDVTYKLRSNKKYSNTNLFNFPNRASISITASQHGNASQLNGKRGGRLSLFSCQPPVWQSQLKPPIYKNSFFFELSNNDQVKEIIEYLADFLTRFDSLQLSIKNPKRMRWVEQWLEDLIDEVIVYVKTIQNLPADWSLVEDIKLKPEHQVLLDCYRQDEAFQNLKTSNWQKVIVQDFAGWLNNRLRKTNENFTPQDVHTKLWIKLFETNFREIFEIKNSTQQEGD